MQVQATKACRRFKTFQSKNSGSAVKDERFSEVIYGNRTKPVRYVDNDDAADTGDYNLRIFAASKRNGGMLACLVSASSDSSCQFFIFILTTFAVSHSFTPTLLPLIFPNRTGFTDCRFVFGFFLLVSDLVSYIADLSFLDVCYTLQYIASLLVV